MCNVKKKPCKWVWKKTLAKQLQFGCTYLSLKPQRFFCTMEAAFFEWISSQDWGQDRFGRFKHVHNSPTSSTKLGDLYITIIYYIIIIIIILILILIIIIILSSLLLLLLSILFLSVTIRSFIHNRKSHLLQHRCETRISTLRPCLQG